MILAVKYQILKIILVIVVILKIIFIEIDIIKTYLKSIFSSNKYIYIKIYQDY